MLIVGYSKTVFILVIIMTWKSTGERCEQVNVRTVLFSDEDLDNEKCWSREDIALLFSRYLMQQLLPQWLPKEMDLISNYLTLCFEETNEMINSQKAQFIILRSMSDIFGGYLQAYGLPLVNEAYYEGNITLPTILNMHSMQGDIKQALATDGGGWPKPMVIKDTIWTVNNLSIVCKKKFAYCDQILFDQNSCNFSKKDPCAKVLSIPIPVLDDNRYPRAIAIPLKGTMLYSLLNCSSQNIIENYYETSACCIREIAKSQKSGCRNESKSYNDMFRLWLNSAVLGHLHEEMFYPAFGGILTIVKYVNKHNFPPDGENKSLQPSGVSTTMKIVGVIIATCTVAAIAAGGTAIAIALTKGNKFSNEEESEEDRKADCHCQGAYNPDYYNVSRQYENFEDCDLGRCEKLK